MICTAIREREHPSASRRRIVTVLILPVLLVALPVTFIGGTAGAKAPKITKPGPPTAVRTISLNTGLGVSWSAPASDGGSAVTSYVANAKGIRHQDGTCTATSALSCTITGLTNGTTYKIKVRASNAKGAGHSSAQVEASPSTVQNCSYLGPDANLQNCDLADINIAGINLTGADLSGVSSGGISGTPTALPPGWRIVSGYIIGPDAVLSNADLSGAVLSNADMEGDALNGADLSNADLTGAQLGFSDLASANLTDANLTNAELGVVRLTGATMAGTDLAGTDPSEETSGGIVGTPSTLPPGWELINGYLVGPQAVLTGADLSNTDLSGDDLFDATLTDADLNGTNFTAANLTFVITGGIVGTPSVLPPQLTLISGYLFGPGANLISADLTDLDLSGLNLSNTNMNAANLDGTNLTGATLTGVSGKGIIGMPAALPSGWVLIGTYLFGPGADLGGANVSNLNLSGLNMTDINLSDANWADADFDGVNLTGANLTGADKVFGLPSLTGVTWSNTTCPDGTNSDNDGDTCVNNLG
jgi:uncharacterized protein YjbI with pentapeptide repeats